MDASSARGGVDFEKFRLRPFVKKLIEIGEVEIHDEPVALAEMSAIIEKTPKAVLFKKAGAEQYEVIAANRSYFGEIDPFGDFDLIFGAAKNNLRIVDLPIRYRERIYGETNIQRWSHGMILLKMVMLAMRRIKFV